jgi:spore maturation protein CgeB
MRALVVHPGPDFSVADVFNGWCKGLTQLGVRVMPYNLGDRLTWAAHAFLKSDHDGSYSEAFPEFEDKASFGVSGLAKAAYYWWPDVVIFVSGFFVDHELVDVMRNRGHKVVCVLTESPYEDTRQLERASVFDAVTLNDPTNLEQFQQVTTAMYSPHCYNPDVHHPGESKYKADVSFVGTGYPSRQAFMSRVDWSGIDLALGGYWKGADETLSPFLVHDPEDCMDNGQTAELYRGSSASFNLYRLETNGDPADSSDGWAIGPREVELAAIGTWFARQSRPESDDLFPMLPTFSSPEELGDQIRWALAHPAERADAAAAARAAIADRTFDRNAAALLQALGI